MGKLRTPKPFVTPSITISSASRVWDTVVVSSLQVGDLIPDFGVVESIHVSRDYPTKTDVATIESVSGKRLRLDAVSEIMAFVNAK